MAPVSVAEILTANSGVLSEQTVWLWDQSTDSYFEKNLAQDMEIAHGQGFFVLVNNDVSFDFTQSMQSHASSGTYQWYSSRPQITLEMSNGTDTKVADIFYFEGSTTGFDNGYDSSIFGGVANEFAIYTHSVSNSQGKNLGIQSLPDNNFENMIIPVGINAVSGTSITINALIRDLPIGMNVFLEDNEDDRVILLNDYNFSTTLESDLQGIGRFYLHTTTLETLNTDHLSLTDYISTYATSEKNLRIIGVQDGTAHVQLYDTLGKEILRSSFEGKGMNDIPLPNLNKGVYIVKLSTQNGTVNRKIIVQ